jgi:hypothetical protein
MGASQQSLQHLFSTVPQLARIILMGGYWEVYQVHQKEVLVEELSWKILAD